MRLTENDIYYLIDFVLFIYLLYEFLDKNINIYLFMLCQIGLVIARYSAIVF
jgi:hypothetical protein